MTVSFYPWPIDSLRLRLSEGDLLHALCGPRRSDRKFDTRENILEQIMSGLTRQSFPFAELSERTAAYKSIAISRQTFLGRTMPDLVLKIDGRLHVLELKANKVDDNRSQCVVGKRLREFLDASGDENVAPYEVEQDLIKLQLFASISDRVDTATLLIIDAYRGRGLKWSRIFSDADSLAGAMETRAMKLAAPSLVRSTSITALSGSNCDADLIVCQVANRSRVDGI